MLEWLWGLFSSYSASCVVFAVVVLARESGSVELKEDWTSLVATKGELSGHKVAAS